MAWEDLQKKAKDSLISCDSIREPFQIITISLLSLLLPLSFLLLARLSCAHYLYNLASFPIPEPYTFLFSFFFYTNPVILYVLVSLVSLATFIYGLTGKTTLLSKAPPSPASQPRLYLAWILLCTLQVCVGLGIEGSIAAGVDGYSFGTERSLLSKIIFFLGLHETMFHWSRSVVKPVVDDTVFGATKEERWIERVAMAMSFGTLWWWRLRDEVEALVIVAEVKKDLSMSLEVGDLMAWWLYYLTVTIGMVRIVKGIMWVGSVLFCRNVRRNPDETNRVVEDKV